jgi:hypothetical protein
MVEVGEMESGTVYHGWADTAHCEVGLVFLNEVPGSFLGECFGCSICYAAVSVFICGDVICDGIPVFLGICVSRSMTLVVVDDGSKGGGDYYTLDLGIVFLGGG